MQWNNKNEMSYEELNKMRWDKHAEITKKLESLQSDLENYLEIWRKSGGGTTGHAIGSMIATIKGKIVFFKNKC